MRMGTPGPLRKDEMGWGPYGLLISASGIGFRGIMVSSVGICRCVIVFRLENGSEADVGQRDVAFLVELGRYRFGRSILVCKCFLIREMGPKLIVSE